MLKNVAGQSLPFSFVSSSDGESVATTGTPTGFVQKDTDASAAAAGTFTHRGNGQWTYEPTKAETNADAIGFQFRLATYITQPITVYTTELSDVADAILTRQMTESYAADGVAPTLAQALFLTMQQAGEFEITDTTITVNGLDGSTPVATFAMDDATNPTSRTRAS